MFIWTSNHKIYYFLKEYVFHECTCMCLYLRQSWKLCVGVKACGLKSHGWFPKVDWIRDKEHKRKRKIERGKPKLICGFLLVPHEYYIILCLTFFAPEKTTEIKQETALKIQIFVENQWLKTQICLYWYYIVLTSYSLIHGTRDLLCLCGLFEFSSRVGHLRLPIFRKLLNKSCFL